MFRKFQAVMAAAALLAGPAAAADAVLFEGVRVFNGTSPTLSAPTNVLVVGKRIAAIGDGALPVPEGAIVTRIAGKGRTLMPGLIDAHTHIMFQSLPQIALLTTDITYVSVAAAVGARDMLMRGFTTARDAGGPVFGVKRAIDTGLIPGPRIWPAGAMLSQSGGHADFRLPNELGGDAALQSYGERVGAGIIADSPDMVRKRAREQLALGASQIKMHAGGGVSSNYDPLDVTQYTVAELRAGVEAAENWGTYVTVHAYTPRAIRQAVEAGVRVIEHGQLIDDATAKLLADKGIWWSLQPFLADEDATPFPAGSANSLKQAEMVAGTDAAYKLARKHRIRTAFGTDTLFDAKIAVRQGAQLTKLLRWYTPAEALIMATSGNADLLALSGKRAPYQGKLGVVEKDALADLLLVEGDPIADIKLIEDPAKNFVVIMKDGVVYKNSVAGK
jgi:imidazolonepropionase-like amidohydrolase